MLSQLNQALELTETSREWLIYKPLQILGYIALALVLRFAGHKLIDRVTAGKIRKPAPAGAQEPGAAHELGAARPARQSAAGQRRAQRARTIGSVFKSVVSIILLIWVILNIFEIIGVNIGPFIASAGIVGLAIGFGAQNLVKDFLSGIFMLLEDQYGVGDVVDFGEAIGTVEAVALRVTTVRDVNGTVWYVRNGEVIRVGNKSQGFAVAVVDVPIKRPVNVVEATELVEATAVRAVADEALAADVLEPPQMLGVDAVNPLTVTLRLTVKVRPGRQWAVKRALNQKIIAALAQFDDINPSPEAVALLSQADPLAK